MSFLVKPCWPWLRRLGGLEIRVSEKDCGESRGGDGEEDVREEGRLTTTGVAEEEDGD